MRLLFGAAIALILLGLYGLSIGFMIDACIANKSLNSGYAFTLSTVGGLVSALIIAQLAVTPPGKPPIGQLFGLRSPDPLPVGTDRIASIISGLYILVWMALGLLAFVYGTLLYPSKIQALTDYGQAWLGLAVAAAYSYFGLTPPVESD